jgi:hypothetical protein
MTITLSDHYRSLAQHQASSAGYSDVADYLEHLIDRAEVQAADRLATVSAVREGLADVAAGRTRPMHAALAELAQKHGLSESDDGN